MGRYSWYLKEFSLNGEDAIEAAEAELRRLPDPQDALVKVSFSGLLSGPEDLERLRNLNALMEQRFFFYTFSADLKPRPETAHDWREALPAGIARAVVDQLLSLADDPDQHPRAMRALEYLLEAAR